MKTKVRVERSLGCCGSVVPYLEPWDEPFDSSELHMMKCLKCGKADFPEAFEKMELVEDVLECQHCNKETKHRLTSSDSWSGLTITICSSCKKENTWNEE